MKMNVRGWAVITMAIFSACNMKKNNTDNAIITGTDSSMMSKTDTTANIAATSAEANSNTPGSQVAARADSVIKVNMATPNPAKKGKMGKVSIAEGKVATGGSMDMDKEGYYSNTEVLPSFPGGRKALESFFEKNLEYPADATDNGIEGTVDLNFAVDEKGKVYSPKIASEKVGYGIEQEALRVFSKMPAWVPGKIKGKNVKTKYTLPVKFQLY